MRGLVLASGGPVPRRGVLAGGQPLRRLLSAAAMCLGGLALSVGAGAAPLNAQDDARSAFVEAQVALAEGRLDVAEILLERVLMLMPEHAEARIDFAVLMARRGQWEVARALLAGLVEDARTPPDHRQRLQGLLAGLGPGLRVPLALTTPQASPVSQTAVQAIAAPQRWRAEAQWAYSSNPLARTGASDITLSLGEGPVSLPLATRPEPGTVGGLLLQHLTEEGGLDVAVQRLGGVEGHTAYRFTAWGALPLPAWAPGSMAWAVSAQQGFDGQRRHTVAVAASHGPRRITWAVYEEPNLPDRGVFVRLDQLTPAWRGVSGQVSAEFSRSTTQHQGFARLGWVAEMPLAPGARLQAQLGLQQDLYGYSPLLENNARRRLISANVAYEQQLAGRLALPLVLRVFAGWRHSNLALFRYRDNGAQLVLVRTW